MNEQPMVEEPTSWRNIRPGPVYRSGQIAVIDLLSHPGIGTKDA